VTLAGTLTLPAGTGPFPAAVLIAGSGPNTRDEPILGHRLFLVLADHLTRHGIAVLRYDKRGTGESTGDYGKATTLDFADDAEAALDYLAKHKAIDQRRVGLIGHSEGGLIAPMVAGRDKAAGFVVALAGPGVNGAQILREQGKRILIAAGTPPDQLETDMLRRDQAIEIVRNEKDPEIAAAKLRAALLDTAKADGKPEEMVQLSIKIINSDWFRFFFDYDPAPAWHALTCPVLVLIGGKDLQVPPDQNLPPIRAALAGNPKAEIEELPGLNHLFQTAQTGSPAEYGRIEETIAPAALDKVADWIRHRAE
jgi:pimeloyl-ACP methyl ester carboxylesterase